MTYTGGTPVPRFARLTIERTFGFLWLCVVALGYTRDRLAQCGLNRWLLRSIRVSYAQSFI